MDGKEHMTILIIRIVPQISKNPEEAARLIKEGYRKAVQGRYAVFRLGDERIVIAPNVVHVEGMLV